MPQEYYYCIVRSHFEISRLRRPALLVNPPCADHCQRVRRGDPGHVPIFYVKLKHGGLWGLSTCAGTPVDWLELAGTPYYSRRKRKVGAVPRQTKLPACLIRCLSFAPSSTLRPTVQDIPGPTLELSQASLIMTQILDLGARSTRQQGTRISTSGTIDFFSPSVHYQLTN